MLQRHAVDTLAVVHRRRIAEHPRFDELCEAGAQAENALDALAQANGDAEGLGLERHALNAIREWEDVHTSIIRDVQDAVLDRRMEGTESSLDDKDWHRIVVEVLQDELNLDEGEWLPEELPEGLASERVVAALWIEGVPYAKAVKWRERYAEFMRSGLEREDRAMIIE